MESVTGKMNNQVIVIFCLLVFVLGISCESTSPEQINSVPLTFVYAVYPFYNSEALLEVWKNDASAEVYANVVTVNPGEKEWTILNAGSTISRNISNDSTANRDVQLLKSDVENASADHLSQSRQQPQKLAQKYQFPARVKAGASSPYPICNMNILGKSRLVCNAVVPSYVPRFCIKCFVVKLIKRK